MVRRMAVASLMVLSLGGVAHAQNSPPDVVLVTHPTAVQNTISGVTPFTVTFNFCKTTDVDAGDVLRFRYDWEGLGFERGICRGTHTYEEAGRYVAVACASDRQPDHEACYTYKVNVEQGPRRGYGTLFFSISLVYADIDADGCADYVSVPWSQTAGLGVEAGTAQVWIPMADTDGDGRPDSIVLDLDKDGNPDPDLQPSGRIAGDCSANTSTSRMVGQWPILVDTDGDGPELGDTPATLNRSGGMVYVLGPWDSNPMDGNENLFLDSLSGGAYNGGSRRNGNVSQRMSITGFGNGGAYRFSFNESGGAQDFAGTGELVDTNGDGIFDTIEGYQQ